jgi:hypothetical protein
MHVVTPGAPGAGGYLLNVSADRISYGSGSYQTEGNKKTTLINRKT